jgi:hypothetical protein
MRNAGKSKSTRMGCVEDVSAAAPLSPEDRLHLAHFENKLQYVRDRTAGVVDGHTNGFCLHAAGGVGKSFTVLDAMERMHAGYVLFNSHATAWGLFDTLEAFPDAVHVLEDMEQLMRDKIGLGVLRSALWSQRHAKHKGRDERVVTWTTNTGRRSFGFSGGIIMISNRPLNGLLETAAAKTRMAVFHLQATDGEMRALMRSMAGKGYEHLGKLVCAKECLEICEFVIEQSHALQRSLDMRLLVNSFDDYLQWEEGGANVNWRDFVAGRLRERAPAFAQEVAMGSRTDRKLKAQDIAREIANSTEDRKERARQWKERKKASRHSTGDWRS